MALLDKYELKTYCVSGDQVAINVRNWRIIREDTGGALPQEIIDTYSLNVSILHKNWMPAAARFIGCSLTLANVIPPTVPPYTSHLGVGDGNRSGDLLPKQVAGLIHLHGTLAGRHGRGRMYIGFGTEVWNGPGGTVIGAALTVLDALRLFYAQAHDFVGATGTTRLEPCLRDRATNAYTLILDSIVDDRWATQKRRGDFGRTNPIPLL
jgi:hypothetical protein